MHPDATKSSLLRSLFDFFSAENVPYCVVGDTEKLPDLIEGDVDFVVSHQTLSILPRLLHTFCSIHGARIVQVLQHEHTAYYYVLALQDSNGRFHHLPLDICSDYVRNGMLFLNNRDFLEDRRRVPSENEGGGFYAAGVATGFIYYLLKRLDKQTLEERHGDFLSRQWHMDPEGCLAQIRRFWDKEIVSFLSVAATNNDWSKVLENSDSIRSAFYVHLRSSFSSKLFEVVRKIKRVLRPTGLWVAFLGPDGCGKSSVLEGVTAMLAPAFRRTRYYHFRPGLERKETNSSGQVTDPHAQQLRSFISSIAKLLFYLFDYVAGYLFKIRRDLTFSTFVTFDRYYTDILADPVRYRYGGPGWLLSGIQKLVPLPDLIILFDAPAEVLQARKQEVSFNESSRQRARYHNLLERLPRGYIIDASEPLDTVIYNTAEIIVEHMAVRSSRRLRLQEREK